MKMDCDPPEPEPIIGILREQEAGAATADVCRKHGISQRDVLQVEGQVRRSAMYPTPSGCGRWRTRTAG